MKKILKDNLAKSVNKVEEKTISFDSGNNLKTISVDELMENEINKEVFREMNEEEFERLKNSISDVGLLQPLSVVKTDKGYKLIAGHQRLKALKELGINTAPVLILNYKDETDGHVALVHANLAARQLNEIDLARAIAYEKNLLKEKKKSGEFKGDINKTVADSLNLSKETLKRVEKLNKLIPEIQDLISKNELAAGKGQIIATLDEETQKLIYDTLKKEIESLSLEELKDFKNQSEEEKKSVMDKLLQAEAENKKILQASEDLKKEADKYLKELENLKLENKKILENLENIEKNYKDRKKEDEVKAKLEEVEKKYKAQMEKLKEENDKTKELIEKKNKELAEEVKKLQKEKKELIESTAIADLEDFLTEKKIDLSDNEKEFINVIKKFSEDDIYNFMSIINKVSSKN